MSHPLACDFCSKPATVHLTQVLNGQVKKVDLCEQCAKKNGITDPEGFSLMDILAKGVFEASAGLFSDHLICARCGYSLKALKKNGRLGCADCYTTFMDILEPMLESLQIGLEHKGKVPKSAQTQLLHQELESLRMQMQKAVKSEDFEAAARLRDQIRKLQGAP